LKARCNPAKMAVIGSIRAYQRLLSPALRRSCKYYPSCSQYAIDAVSRYGVARGMVLAAWRVLRCNPLSYGGYDPVERQRLFGSRGGAPAAPGSAGRA
jgi:putative membrane protein insertion efficiency factor